MFLCLKLKEKALDFVLLNAKLCKFEYCMDKRIKYSTKATRMKFATRKKILLTNFNVNSVYIDSISYRTKASESTALIVWPLIPPCSFAVLAIVSEYFCGALLRILHSCVSVCSHWSRLYYVYGHGGIARDAWTRRNLRKYWLRFYWWDRYTAGVSNKTQRESTNLTR